MGTLSDLVCSSHNFIMPIIHSKVRGVRWRCCVSGTWGVLCSQQHWNVSLVMCIFGTVSWHVVHLFLEENVWLHACSIPSLHNEVTLQAGKLFSSRFGRIELLTWVISNIKYFCQFRNVFLAFDFFFFFKLFFL